MKLSATLVLLLSATTTIYAHSWVACTDYRGDINYYNPAQCYGYARNWGNVGGGVAFGVDRGFDYQGSNSKACRDPLGNAPDYGYSNIYPMAKYSPGQQICLAWPSKNHVAATCTNPYIPDTELEVYVSAKPTGNQDPTQAQFKQTLVKNLTTHVNGVIDFKGFQHCPKFCENMDKSLCTQCFNIPSNLQTGQVYTFQWYWVFNAGSPAYTTCWEAMITGSGGSGGGSSTTGRPATTTAVSSTTGRPGNTGNAGTTGTIIPPPVCSGSGTGAGSGTGLPTGGESVAVSSAPFIIPNSGSFDVIVAYTAPASRLITVDVLDTKPSPTWYGKGTATISAGSGTTSVRVTLQTTPPTGPNYVLRAWSIDTQYANSQEPWTYELSRNDFPVSVGGSSAFYAASTAPCEDSTPCADLCGGADQVNSCNCDDSGHVNVLCKDTPAPQVVAPVASTGMVNSISMALVAVVAAVVAVCF